MKTKTNKWVDPTRPTTIMEQIEQLEMRFLALSLDHPRQEWKTFNEHLNKLITQTQQETLEWCLKEVVGKVKDVSDADEHAESFEDIARYGMKFEKGYNKALDEMRQTIKQRKEEK